MTLKNEERLNQRPNMYLYFKLSYNRQELRDLEGDKFRAKWRDRGDKNRSEKKMNNLEQCWKCIWKKME